MLHVTLIVIYSRVFQLMLHVTLIVIYSRVFQLMLHVTLDILQRFHKCNIVKAVTLELVKVNFKPFFLNLNFSLSFNFSQ